MLTPRPYQEKVIQATINELNNYKRPFVIDAFQSSGKSLMIAELVRRLKQPILILCMNKELVEQDRDKIAGQGVDVTMYSASTGEKIISDVTVGTIQSIYKYPEFCNRFGVVIIDECDALPCDNPKSMYMKLLSKLRVKVVGWTGTPFRMTKKFGKTKSGDITYTTMIMPLNRIGMTGGKGFFWGKIIHGVSYKELAAEEFVAPIRYYIEESNMSMLKVNSTGADYTEESLRDFGASNVDKIADVVRRVYHGMNNKRIMVTVPNISDAEAVVEKLGGIGNTTVLHSKIPNKTRTKIIEDYKSGDIKIVVQVMMLNVGFDLPALDVVVFARPCLSLRIWCQTVARAIRLDPEDDDKFAKIIDMSGMVKKFGRIEDVEVKKEPGGFRDTIVGTYGEVSGKILSEVNITQIQQSRGV